MTLRSNAFSFALLAVALPFVLGASGCPNVFLASAQTETDDALLYSAKILADNRDWDGAMTALGKMTTTGRAKRDTVVMEASVLAGRCGLDLMDLADKLSNMGSATFWPYVLTAYKGGTSANVTDCIAAETKMLSITTTFSQFTTDENVLLAFIELAKMGRIISVSGIDDSDSDGLVDSDMAWASVAYCSGTTTASTSVIVDDYVKHLGTGLFTFAQALSASGLSIASSVTTSLTNTCATLEAVPAYSGICTATSITSYTTSWVKAIRMLLQANEVGFNQCGGSISYLGCLCP